jgi:Zn-dependent peptidase ImmA (M78 family)
LRSTEGHATALRARAGVDALERLDPRALAHKFGIIVADLDDLTDLAPEDRAHLRSVDAKVWSGMGMPLPDGQLLVLLNPSQTPERAASTIMEEVAHAHLGHQPSQLVTEANGMVRRLYDAAIEREAKWTAAAALLPAKAVARAVWTGTPAQTLASEFGVSVELVEFRIKILHLWSEYCGCTVAA